MGRYLIGHALRQLAGIGFRRFLIFHIMGRGKGGRTAIRCSNNNLPGVFLAKVTDHIDSSKIGFTFVVGNHIPVGIHCCS